MNLSLVSKAGCAALAAATISLSAPSAHAQLLYTATGTVLRTLADVSGTVTSPFGTLLVGVAQIADPRLAHTMIRIQGRYLSLAPGTAAFDISFTYGGQSRRFVVIRPEPATSGAPLQVMLHGNGGTAENQGNISGVADLVAQKGVWAALPDALNGTWDGDPGNPMGIDDVGFIATVIAIMKAGYASDPRHVFISGLSNGAFMAERFACERSDLIAAAAFVAGTISNGEALACAPAIPRPVMFVDGTTDPIVPYDGSRIGVQSAQSAYSFWLARHNCNASASTVTNLPNTANDGTNISLTRNAACGSGKEVRLYTVYGGGHAWPGGWQYLPVPIIGTTSQDMNATMEIFNFASAYQVY